MTDFELDIEAISQDVKKHHAAQKEETKELANARERFFEAVNEQLKAQPRAQQTIMIPVDKGVTSDEDVETYIHTFFPGWKITSVEYEPFRAIVEEDPEWMKFTYISKDRKTVFQRNIVQASPSLDDDQLKKDDPDLWLRVTRSPEEELLERLVDEKDTDGTLQGAVQSFVREHRDEFLRLLQPFDTLSEEDYNAIQDYILPGALSPRLEKPRKPKPEELE